MSKTIFVNFKGLNHQVAKICLKIGLSGIKDYETFKNKKNFLCR